MALQMARKIDVLPQHTNYSCASNALQVSSGATDDLRQATNMARHMVMQCGLNDAVGPVFIEDGDMKGLSEGLRQQVDEGE